MKIVRIPPNSKLIFLKILKILRKKEYNGETDPDISDTTLFNNLHIRHGEQSIYIIFEEISPYNKYFYIEVESDMPFDLKEQSISYSIFIFEYYFDQLKF